MTSITNTSFITLLYFTFFISLPFSTFASYNVSALFAFGDSTMDAGNNNHFNTPFRGDHLPYGRDLPNHVPTGRFSNGKLSTDYLVHILGLKDLLPAYLNSKVTDHDLLTGVTFGSGGSGLDNKTIGITKVLDLATQFEMFEEAMQRIRKSVGEEKSRDIIENALFIISIGTNDMLYNAYFLPVRLSQYGNVSRYQDFLLQNLLSFVQRLYGAGARRIIVAGLPPMGCLPLLVTLNSILPAKNWFQRVCNVQQNRDSQGYNTKLQSHIQSLHATLKGAKVGYFDIYTPILDMVQNPASYGFHQTHKGCCGTGLLEMGPICNVLDTTCPDASKYLFWDAVHPSQAGYWFLTQNGRKTVLPYVTS
ncbi:GDSL esterase/lipase At2g40250-like [Gastrolobium bilobum]|uniref:GDSL esterase/lipase At2g40250-like n=1 Tax=Gastrolobium bilobum TaxID=150636 RepID=UPI002AAFACE8|nr:GDSL esterase/lipase At2g40250-like [Gastrolobium bilobum]